MTQTLVLGLLVEGPSDQRFLPIVVQRTAEELLLHRGRATTDVWDPIVFHLPAQVSLRSEQILYVARQAAGYHGLVIHCDADYATAERAFQERFEPGRSLVTQARAEGQQVCTTLIPLIPVQMMESWMLADPVTFHAIIGTRLAVADLGLPEHPHQVESITQPKARLLDAIQKALSDRPRRRRHPQQELVLLQEQLARQIQLNRLRNVPSFQLFERDLALALAALHLLA